MSVIASAITIPNRRGRYNPRTPEKAQSRARCATRTACMADPRLSVWAKQTYYWMDDYARCGGVAYPKQKTLAAKVGCKVRKIQQCIAELIAAGWISPGMATGRAKHYTLKWAMGVPDTRSGAYRISICEAVRIEAETPAAEPESEAVTTEPTQPSQDCPKCHGAGVREYDTRGIDTLGRPNGRRFSGRCGCLDTQRPLQTPPSATASAERSPDPAQVALGQRVPRA